MFSAAKLCALILAALCFLPLFALAGPKIETWTLPNGARVYFVEAHELPILQVRTVFDAGAARDPKDKKGLALLTSVLLRDGAEGMNADDIASRFEGLGAEFGAIADREMASVDLRSLTDSSLLQPVLDLYARILRAPSFQAESLERQRQRMLVALARDRQNPGAVAQKAFMRALYGDHPYGNEPGGDEESLKRITRDDIVAYHRRHYVGRNAWVAIVGNLTLMQAQRVSALLVGGLPEGEPTAALEQPPALAQASENKIAFPASQSHLFVGQIGMARSDPDYFPLYVGNHILGGSGLVSRLSDDIRERRGLAYSVYSYFSPMRVPGPFVIGLQTKNASRDDAYALAQKALTDFIKDGPTDAELEAAKKNITGGFPLRLDSNRKIADNLAVIAFYGLPLTYLDTYSARVQAVSAQQIREAFARHVQPDKLLTVMVGGGT